jgi:multidrug transporter EmrE-like cation transporter
MAVNPWIYLVLTEMMEVGWAVGLKFTEGFIYLIPSIITAIHDIKSMFTFFGSEFYNNLELDMISGLELVQLAQQLWM